ncbi:MAG TPA: SRPBCC family protein [Candidatus Thermoplasmatota archaeon]|nr:SRPBCC family protein [Candidatus Thermoplasmatota archaeon]
MALEWSFSAQARAPPDEVFAWLSDFRDDDHSAEAFLRGAGWRRGKRPATRRILERAGNVVRLQDRWGGSSFSPTVTLDPAARTVTIEGEYGYRAVWRVEPTAEGSEVSVGGRLAPSGLARLLLPVFGWAFRRQLEGDFRGHMAHLRHDLEKS